MILITMGIEILIPLLNDFEELQLLAQDLGTHGIAPGRELKISVCDGGSHSSELSKTRDLCEKYRWQLHLSQESPTSLSRVLQAAIKKSTNETILILPSDCRINNGHLKEVAQRSDQMDWGGFPKRYFSTSKTYAIYLFVLNQVLARRGFFVWTNVIFAKKSLLVATDWPEGSFLIDWALTKALRRNHPFYFGHSTVAVNDRKYLARGKIRQIIKNGWVIFLYEVGFKKPELLRKIYS